MFDDAINNYKRKIMIQASAIKFIHRTIIIAQSSLSKLFIKMPQNIFKTAKICGTPPAQTN